MHSVVRPDAEPDELDALRKTGSEDFGTLGQPLDLMFNGVCAYCERKPLWRSRQDGVGTDDTDLPDREGLLFTCDHFRPRRLLCNPDSSVGQCSTGSVLHTHECTIYDWHNLVYACQPCNAVKGGQWPADDGKADAYINPCEDPSNLSAPNRVFRYDLDSGRLTVQLDTDGVVRANALRTILDLALNDPRERIETTHYSAQQRRISLADLRERWVRDLRRTLDTLAEVAPSALVVVVSGFVSPESRFSSICRQLIEETEYRRYLP